MDLRGTIVGCPRKKRLKLVLVSSDPKVMVQFCYLKLFPVVCSNEKDGRGMQLEKVEMPTKIAKAFINRWFIAHL